MKTICRAYTLATAAAAAVALSALARPSVAAAPLAPATSDRLGQAPHVDAAQRSRTRHLYDAWKRRYLRRAPCRADEMYVRTTGDAGHENDITVSEAHGYGMLLLASMGVEDASAQKDFDAMVRLMLRHDVSAEVPLMTWRLDDQCARDVSETSAPDGDLDMAYALLLADAAWGSNGALPYRKLALARMQAIMAHIVHGADGPAPYIGLWEHEHMDGGSAHARGSRLSDFMPGHFRAFYQASQDARWLRLIDFGYATLAQLQADHVLGLLPDFIVFKGEKYLRAHPAPAGFLEGDNDGHYSYNACRLPWRLAADPLPDARAHGVALALIRGLLQVSHGRPQQLVDGYTLTGDKVGDTFDRLAFVAPAAWLMHTLPETRQESALWVHHARRLNGADQHYFNDTLQLLTLVQATPRTQP